MCKIRTRWRWSLFKLFCVVLISENKIKHFGILVTSVLNLNAHISKQIAKANNVLYLLRRNIAYNVSMRVKRFSFLAFNDIFFNVKGLHLVEISRESSELDLWKCLIHSTDQNAEYTPATDVHTVAKLVANFTALKQTSKQQQAATNTGYVIAIK